MKNDSRPSSSTCRLKSANTFGISVASFQKCGARDMIVFHVRDSGAAPRAASRRAACSHNRDFIDVGMAGARGPAARRAQARADASDARNQPTSNSGAR